MKTIKLKEGLKETGKNYLVDLDDYTGDIKTTTNNFWFFDFIKARLLLDTISTSDESEEFTKTLKN